MKKLLIILLSISLFSCSNYKKAEELYFKGVEEKSTSILIDAQLKLKRLKKVMVIMRMYICYKTKLIVF